ncbi:hypothetical protein [Cupriavidus taiwanensis]|uniref:hypothetical protein n=1 Tax=Cupriavidus taiwanensis TaxID=164546 RepID=UPI000E1AC115|nr:hypothetical protein [Cupriavidus taiwanensis]SPC18355.1 hypothetical protein CT19431_MP30298 [Cupriavidus taiwanensis]
MNLCLDEFPRLCVPDPQLSMPKRDVLGNLTGSQYSPGRFAGVRKRRYSTVAITNSLKGSQRHVSAGIGLTALDQVLKLNPYVFEARGNYAYVEPFAQIGQSYPPLVDCMLTVELRSNPGQPHLHALFVTKSRKERLEERLLAHGVTVELVDARLLSRVALHNAARCYQTLLGLDIRTLKGEARQFANMLLADYEGFRAEDLTLDECMDAMAKSTGCGIVNAFNLLCTAHAYGFVRIDPTHELLPYRSLLLEETHREP